MVSQLILPHTHEQVPNVASTGGLVNTVVEGFTGFQMGAFNVEVISRPFLLKN